MLDDIKLMFTSGWADQEIYPVNESTIKHMREYLDKEHGEGCHEVTHVIQCSLCQREYNR